MRCGFTTTTTTVQGFANAFCQYATEYAVHAPNWEVASSLEQLCGSDDGLVEARLRQADEESKQKGQWQIAAADVKKGEQRTKKGQIS